jgi:hypothetical protein
MAGLPASRLVRGARRLYRRSRAGSDARAELRFQPRLRPDPEGPQLILSPHWDDAVLSCWSVLTGGGDVRVVNVFAGIPQPGRRGAWERLLGVADSAERARMRRSEDAEALSRAGREAVNLALVDDPYRLPTGDRARLADVDAALVDAGIGSAARVYAPAGIGGHRDHLLVRRYASRLFAAGIPVTLYADVPYCFFHGWPSWVDGLEPEPDRDVDEYWLAYLGGLPEVPALRDAEVVRLDGAASAAKGEAVGLYAASLNYGVRRLLRDRAFNGFEVRWRLVAPGGGSIAPAAAQPAAESELELQQPLES